jgi:DNA polymerase-3 subunit epsilon
MRVRSLPRGAGAAAYKRARLPSGRSPWRAASYCAVDLELSGLDPKQHEIVSFGAVPIEDGRVQLSAAVYGRIRPLGSMSTASIRVHGMRIADLADAPPLDVAIDPLLAAMAGRVPVVHVAAIERSFLRPALRRQGLRLRRPMIDTSVLGLIWLHERDGNAPRHTSLTELAEALGLPAHSPHDAIGDALTTAQAFVALATHLDAQRGETVRSLSSAGRRLQSLRDYSLPQHPTTGPARR